MVRAELSKIMPGRTIDAKLPKLLFNLNQEKAKIDTEIAQSQTVKLHSHAYEIDFEAY